MPNIQPPSWLATLVCNIHNHYPLLLLQEAMELRDDLVVYPQQSQPRNEEMGQQQEEEDLEQAIEASSKQVQPLNLSLQASGVKTSPGSLYTPSEFDKAQMAVEAAWTHQFSDFQGHKPTHIEALEKGVMVRGGNRAGTLEKTGHSR